jgi:hypothetical protein
VISLDNCNNLSHKTNAKENGRRRKEEKILKKLGDGDGNHIAHGFFSFSRSFLFDPLLKV